MRDYFAYEAKDLTPWVAKHLGRIGNAMYLESRLELVGTEQKIAGYRIDVLAKTKVDGADRFVVIENQLERSDADHLGRLITCAAEINASHAIWVGVDFRADHLRVMESLAGSMGCQFVALQLDAAITKQGSAYIDFVLPSTYEYPEDHLRAVLQDATRWAQRNYLTLIRLKRVRELYSGADYTRYRRQVEEMGLWSAWTDQLADKFLEEAPTSRRTGPVVPANAEAEGAPKS
ncbi:hypothetical protein ABIA32_000001 [Streptacidiphilus sp. MAP12-20]|uniref:hypothetical protein n=1 Tax=Streptacidiphilus sp. MAP12-20 TaxID=3156299 RepID=UPI003515B903